MSGQVQYDRRYKTLAVVHSCESYAAAAKHLALTASAVAQQIHSLERELKVHLFLKCEKKLLPTRECDIVAEYVEKIEAVCSRLEDELNARQRKMRHLVAGVTPSVENSVMSLALSRYAAENGDVQISILSESSETLYRMLKDGSVDFAVVEGGFPEGEFNSIILDTDYLVVAAANSNPLTKRSMLTLDDLRRERLILRSSDSGTRKLFEAYLKKIGIDIGRFDIMMEADSAATIKKLVENNYGISILSHKACLKDEAEGRFRTIPVCDMNLSRKIHLFYRSNFLCKGLLRDIQRLYNQVIQE